MNGKKRILSLLAAGALAAGASRAALDSSVSTALDQEIQTQIGELDKNQDGGLDRTEAVDRPRLARGFDRLDRDRDGVLRGQELERLGRILRVHRLHAMSREARRELLFARADGNHDGVLSLEEFLSVRRHGEVSTRN